MDMHNPLPYIAITSNLEERKFHKTCAKIGYLPLVPQYVRKSVDVSLAFIVAIQQPDQVIQGLSITLFVCAFMGNLLYVSSILTSPKLSLPEKEAAAFLKESVP